MRLTLRQAAAALGVSESAIRKRVERGTLRSDKGPDGRRYVYLDNVADTVTDQRADASAAHEGDALISELRAHNDTLREQLESERQAHGEARRIIAGLVESIPAIKAPSEALDVPDGAAQNGSTRIPRVRQRPPPGGNRGAYLALIGLFHLMSALFLLATKGSNRSLLQRVRLGNIVLFGTTSSAAPTTSWGSSPRIRMCSGIGPLRIGSGIRASPRTDVAAWRRRVVFLMRCYRARRLFASSSMSRWSGSTTGGSGRFCGGGYFCPMPQSKTTTSSSRPISPLSRNTGTAARAAADSGLTYPAPILPARVCISEMESSLTASAVPPDSLRESRIRKSPTAEGTLIPEALVFASCQGSANLLPDSNALTIGAQPSDCTLTILGRSGPIRPIVSSSSKAFHFPTRPVPPPSGRRLRPV